MHSSSAAAFIWKPQEPEPLFYLQIFEHNACSSFKIQQASLTLDVHIWICKSRRTSLSLSLLVKASLSTRCQYFPPLNFHLCKIKILAIQLILYYLFNKIKNITKKKKSTLQRYLKEIQHFLSKAAIPKLPEGIQSSLLLFRIFQVAVEISIVVLPCIFWKVVSKMENLFLSFTLCYFSTFLQVYVHAVLENGKGTW